MDPNLANIFSAVNVCISLTAVALLIHNEKRFSTLEAQIAFLIAEYNHAIHAGTK